MWAGRFHHYVVRKVGRRWLAREWVNGVQSFEAYWTHRRLWP